MTRTIFLFALLILSTQSCKETEKASKSDDFTIEFATVKETEAWATQAEAILARIQAPNFPSKAFSITDFGAKAEEGFDSRPAILEAIDECHKAGGGKVIFPSGTWFSKGPIHLKDNVNLYLEEGSVLRFSDQAEDYLPLVKVRWEGTVCWNYSPLIYAFQKNNIALTGKGTIDGNAAKWSIEWRTQQNPDKKVLRQMGNDQIPEDHRVFGNGFLDLDQDGEDDGFGDGKQHWLRPTLVEFYECNNILLEELTLKNSPFWTIHPVFSKNITIKNLQVYGGYLNDDGIDPDSSEDILIEGCYIETEDDAISIKAGRDQDAWDRGKSRNIVVRNCRLNSGVNSFCVGSEMSGGVENIFVEDCHILSGKHGLNFKCNLDRGGHVENIFLRNIEIDSVQEAMFIFRMDYHGYRGNNFPTKFNDFFASNITCSKVNEKPFKIVGVEVEPITRVALRNITIQQAGMASEIEFAQEIITEGVKVNGSDWKP